MSPTVFRHRSYRFCFFSREEERAHVHAYSPDGEAISHGLSQQQLGEMRRIVEER